MRGELLQGCSVMCARYMAQLRLWQHGPVPRSIFPPFAERVPCHVVCLPIRSALTLLIYLFVYLFMLLYYFIFAGVWLLQNLQSCLRGSAARVSVPRSARCLTNVSVDVADVLFSV